MWTNTLGCGAFSSSTVIRGDTRASVKMCRLVVLVTLFAMNIHASSQIPPRLSSCRVIHKSAGSEDYTFTTDESCGLTISLPLSDNVELNVTDHRNCENYFTCARHSCKQCPCPDGQTFNPLTLTCDSTNSLCACPVESTTTPTTTPSTTVEVIKLTTTKQLIPVHNAGTEGQQSSGDNSIPEKPPVSTEVIIIAGIVSATVIVIVVIVMGVFCWQRRHSSQPNSPINKPPPCKKLSTPNHEGYSSSIPPTEKHEYAEIDERMINGRKHWQHGGSIRAPPLPNHEPPPTFPTAPPASLIYPNTCPHHPRSDSGLGSADTSFTANYPRRTFQPINPAHSIQIGVAYNERPPNGNCCNCDEPYHGREDSSASSESHYSNSSNPLSVDSRDVDMRTPLHGKQHYMSKQVYI